MIQTLSVLLGILGASMLVPCMVDFAVGNPDWRVFLASSLAVMLLSSLVFLAARRQTPHISRRSVFLFVTLVWVLFSIASALPFFFSGLDLSFTDAFFEAASGLTTTGSTILTGLDAMPPGILLWRSITQWIGGLGIVVLGISMLPFMRSGGQQMFSLESSDTADKPFPKTEQYAERILLIYVALTLSCTVAYRLLGMTGFEAINHAMTTVSTGGFSTSDGSMGHFATTGMLLASSIFMFIGGVPFLFLIRITTGSWQNDIQIRYYVGVILFATVAIVIYRAGFHAEADLHDLAPVLFNVVSVVTTTGFASEDYLLWGPAAVGLFFIITFVGGCAGSTAGGFKQFRFVILHQVVNETLSRLMKPNWIVIPRYGERRIEDEVSTSVMIFSFLYAITFIFCALVYSLLGMDFATATSASATALANVGPGIGGVIGPAGNFAGLPDIAKWMLAGEMIIGRLEIMCVFALFMPAFWRR